MKSTRKILCLLLSVAMLVSCFAFSASAAPADGKEVAYKLVTDKTSYNPGDTVTFTLYVDVADPATPYGASSFYFSYDNTVFSPTVSNRKFYNEFATVYAATSPVTSSAKVHNAIKPALVNTGESALYNASFVVGGVWDGTCGIPSADGIALTPGAAQISFEMKILDTATPGTTSSVAITQGAINTPTRMYLKHADGSKVASADFDLTNAKAEINIASAASNILNPGKSQIRFDENADGTYANKFAVRQLAVVSKADFERTFGATVEAQKAAIAEVGYVFARTSTVATFDVAAAKALIENGTAAEGYTKLTVDYITTKADLVGEGNYGFSCIVANIPDADNTDGISALAYIKGNDGTFHYYPAAAETSFNTLYNTYKDSAFPA